MKKPLEDFLVDADEATRRVSELARNLGLGAIAVVWIFKNPEGKGALPLLPSKLLIWALFFAVSGLGIDLLHYIFRSRALTRYFRRKEKAYDAGVLTEAQVSDMHTPKYIIVGSDIFWWVKISSVVISYILISIFLISRLS